MTFLSDRAIQRLRHVANWPDLGTKKYSVVQELGHGGMGTVYLATDEELGRAVALKVSNAPAPHTAIEARMRTEARILGQLEHPGIVPIHDVGRLVDGRVFYVMKAVKGLMLEQHLEGTPSRDERLRIFERICEPVAFAHAKGYIHRDLKPENIMVGSFGEVLVMDWGVAKVLGEREPVTGIPGAAVPEVGTTEPGTVMGTPGYMAPEQAAGDVEGVDERSDVYALSTVPIM